MAWTRKFPKPIRTNTGVTLRTLAEARDFILNLEENRTWRNEWQNAAGKLMKASDGGDVAEAREAVRNALFHSMMLDFNAEK